MSNLGKYTPLYNWLVDQGEDKTSIELSFKRIEEIIGDALPKSALEYSAWWLDRSENTTHSQAKSWLEAGWQIEQVDLTAQQVYFTRAKPEKI
jgi:hypothetical protein